MSTMSTTLTDLLAHAERVGEANFQRYKRGEQGPFPCYVCGEPVEDWDPEDGTPSSCHFTCTSPQVKPDSDAVRFTASTFYDGTLQSTAAFANLYGAYSRSHHNAGSNYDRWSWIIADARTGEVHAEFVGELGTRKPITV